CSAGQHDDAGAAADVAAGVKDIRRLELVIADMEGQAGTCRVPKAHRKPGAFGVPCEVLSWVADRDQGLLQDAAERGIDLERIVVCSLAEVDGDLLVSQQLCQQRLVLANELEMVPGPLQPHPTVAADDFAD